MGEMSICGEIIFYKYERNLPSFGWKREEKKENHIASKNESM